MAVVWPLARAEPWASSPGSDVKPSPVSEVAGTARSRCGAPFVRGDAAVSKDKALGVVFIPWRAVLVFPFGLLVATEEREGESVSTAMTLVLLEYEP